MLSLEVQSSTEHSVTTSLDQMITSFSSKSEIALDLSLHQRSVSFVDYLAPLGAIDFCDSNAESDLSGVITLSGLDIASLSNDRGLRAQTTLHANNLRRQ
ncbi:hypothetical protein [Bradyrhizobium sp. USDA 10063]